MDAASQKAVSHVCYACWRTRAAIPPLKSCSAPCGRVSGHSSVVLHRRDIEWRCLRRLYFMAERQRPLNAALLWNCLIMLRSLIVVCCCLLALAPAVQSNELAGNPSPYLALHGHDPVDWHSWNAAALSKAHREDKLIFVSLGYFSCHWCHVMQRESFANPEIGKILNAHFVSIKVDRELNPVLDDRLMTFVQATAGRGGWPLNVFLTPDGYPLFGMTYAPPEEFKRTLTKLYSRWKSERQVLEQAAQELDDMLAQSQLEANQTVDGLPIAALKNDFIDAALRHADELKGGFGQRAKFPSTPQLNALLTLGSERSEVTEFLTLTLDHMAQQGLRDLVGGGFFRYTVDPNWETPHYEKMLYTNALLVRLYLNAANQLARSDYTEVALDTLTFMEREMSAPGGAFIASLSAVDDHNHEGGYYLFQQKQLKSLLTEKALQLVNVAWGMDRYYDEETEILPRWEKSADEVATAFNMSPAQLKKQLSEVRSKLLAYREKTRRIPKDDKRLSGWNGLTLSAYADSLSVTPSHRARGEALAKFLAEKVWSGKQLYRAVDAQDHPLGDGSLEDYAYVSAGLLDWAMATNNKNYLQIAAHIIQQAWTVFHHPQGWLKSTETLLPNPVYEMHISDGPIPSPEALLLESTRRLAQRNAKFQPLLKKARTSVQKATQAIVDSPYFYASLISAANGLTVERE